MKYKVIINYNTKDNAFIAGVLELAGCMVDGQTYVEAVKNAEIVIKEWIETAQSNGRAIPEARGKMAYV